MTENRHKNFLYFFSILDCHLEEKQQECFELLFLKDSCPHIKNIMCTNRHLCALLEMCVHLCLRIHACVCMQRVTKLYIKNVKVDRGDVSKRKSNRNVCEKYQRRGKEKLLLSSVNKKNFKGLNRRFLYRIRATCILN